MGVAELDGGAAAEEVRGNDPHVVVAHVLATAAGILERDCAVLLLVGVDEALLDANGHVVRLAESLQIIASIEVTNNGLNMSGSIINGVENGLTLNEKLVSCKKYSR